jgi:hypothetical protein
MQAFCLLFPPLLFWFGNRGYEFYLNICLLLPSGLYAQVQQAAGGSQQQAASNKQQVRPSLAVAAAAVAKSKGCPCVAYEMKSKWHLSSCTCCC